MTIEIPENINHAYLNIRNLFKDFVLFSQADYHHLMSILKQSGTLRGDEEKGTISTGSIHFALIIVFDSNYDQVGPKIFLNQPEFLDFVEYLSAVRSS